jgi:mono/diheme cytochrome c family protein
MALAGPRPVEREAPKLEIAIATWLLHQSVPAQAQRRANPLGSDAADIVAGRDLFRENCEICHGYDGGGRTRIGGREYPHAPPLRVAVASMSDGEVFLSHSQRHQKHGDARLGHA